MNRLEESNQRFAKFLEDLFYPKLSYRSINKNYSFKENTNYKTCAECGGECCKACGCHFSPDDFKEISFEYLKKELEKGYISIDVADGDEIYDDFRVFFLRIRNLNSDVVDTGVREKSPCILLTEHGCKFDYNMRPSGGKLLIPDKLGGKLCCYSKYNIRDCCYEWKPHQKILSKLVDYFEGKDIPCSL